MDYSLLLGICYSKIKQGKIEKEGNERKCHSDSEYEAESGDSQSQHTEILDAMMVVGPGRYVIGVIDMLQKYNLSKKSERCIKAFCLCKDKNGISCVPPKEYRERFLEKMTEIGIGQKIM